VRTKSQLGWLNLPHLPMLRHSDWQTTSRHGQVAMKRRKKLLNTSMLQMCQATRIAILAGRPKWIL